MRAILHKKIYSQQSSNSTVLSKKNYLESRHISDITKSTVIASEEKPDHKGDDSDSDDNGSKWDKTDSECKHLLMVLIKLFHMQRHVQRNSDNLMFMTNCSPYSF